MKLKLFNMPSRTFALIVLSTIAPICAFGAPQDFKQHTHYYEIGYFGNYVEFSEKYLFPLCQSAGLSDQEFYLLAIMSTTGVFPKYIIHHSSDLAYEVVQLRPRPKIRTIQVGDVPEDWSWEIEIENGKHTISGFMYDYLGSGGYENLNSRGHVILDRKRGSGRLHYSMKKMVSRGENGGGLLKSSQEYLPQELLDLGYKLKQTDLRRNKNRKSTKEQLEDLDRMLEDDLISEKEYKNKRIQILETL